MGIVKDVMKLIQDLRTAVEDDKLEKDELLVLIDDLAEVLKELVGLIPLLIKVAAKK